MLVKEDYGITEQIISSRSVKTMLETVLRLNKLGLIGEDEFQILVSFSLGKFIESELEKRVNNYINFNFKHYLEGRFMSGGK